MLRLLALQFCLVLCARAQTGVVRANGIPVPGATVKATQGDVTLTTITGDQGQYRLDGLKDGDWKFEVQMFGFDTVRKDVSVQGQDKQEWSLTLKTQTAAATARTRPPEGAGRRYGAGSAAAGSPTGPASGGAAPGYARGAG